VKKLLLWSIGLALVSATLAAVGGGTYIEVIQKRIDNRIEALHSARGTHFYALYQPLQINQKFSQTELQGYLEDQGYSPSRNPEDVRPGEYALRKDSLTLFRIDFKGAGHGLDRQKVKLHLEQEGELFTIKEISNFEGKPLEIFESRPKLIASFVAGRLRTQNAIQFSEIPVSMRLAVMAIEDVHFLEHGGVSVRSTVRALWKDLQARRYVEGGSTITQQLMKNLFFSHEKALSRKLKEAVFAFVTESRHSKEEILEAYLNEVYLGQWSTHEIHGVSEGARYYFNRPASELSLAQSATLAAIIQAPAVHDPRRYPEKTIKRRNVVLKQMLNAGFILPDEYDLAAGEPLGVIPADRSLDDADYFMDLVMERLPAEVRSQLETQSYSIYTTVNPYLQANASRLLKSNIKRLQKLSRGIQLKEKRGYHLQSALISINVKDCSVLALQGGFSYRQTQFNRVLQGKRQPGSLFKPFVMLAACGKGGASPITPITEVEDTPFEWRYENQVWTPKNYEEDLPDKVTVRQALEHSINIPTARIAQTTGIDLIVNALTQAGVRSPLPLVPSLSLGSAEVTPFELAQAYTTLANLGKFCELRPFVEIFDENKNFVANNELKQTQALPPQPTFITVNVMKGVFTHGTARSAMASALPLQNFAGKTGTTNDAKDAWFVGFSPSILTLVWVGYDEEEKVGLTGAVAALPLWVEFMKSARPFLSPDDFVPPDGVVSVDIDPQTHLLASPACPQKEQEYFIKGTEPTAFCTQHRQ